MKPKNQLTAIALACAFSVTAFACGGDEAADGSQSSNVTAGSQKFSCAMQGERVNPGAWGEGELHVFDFMDERNSTFALGGLMKAGDSAPRVFRMTQNTSDSLTIDIEIEDNLLHEPEAYITLQLAPHEVDPVAVQVCGYVVDYAYVPGMSREDLEQNELIDIEDATYEVEGNDGEPKTYSDCPVIALQPNAEPLRVTIPEAEDTGTVRFSVKFESEEERCFTYAASFGI